MSPAERTPNTVEYDYENQAWTRNGVYETCGHPPEMDCQCYGKIHAGEVAPKQPTARDRFLPYVSFVVDDAGSGRELGADQHAIVREAGDQFTYASRLVGWQCGFEPLFVAVHSYLDVEIDDQDAEEMARDYLEERKWFAGEPTEPDHLIR